MMMMMMMMICRPRVGGVEGTLELNRLFIFLFAILLALSAQHSIELRGETTCQTQKYCGSATSQAMH